MAGRLVWVVKRPSHKAERPSILREKRIRVALLATALLVSDMSFALTTMGDRSSGQWMGNKSNAISHLGDVAWLSGILTGLAIGMNVDILAEPDGDSIALWMDNYCRAHPLDKLSAGAVALALELRSSMPKQ